MKGDKYRDWLERQSRLFLGLEELDSKKSVERFAERVRADFAPRYPDTPSSVAREWVLEVHFAASKVPKGRQDAFYEAAGVRELTLEELDEKVSEFDEALRWQGDAEHEHPWEGPKIDRLVSKLLGEAGDVDTRARIVLFAEGPSAELYVWVAERMEELEVPEEWRGEVVARMRWSRDEYERTLPERELDDDFEPER